MKRILALTISILLVVLSFTSCSDNAQNTDTSAPGSSGSNTVDTVLVPVELDFDNFEKGKLNYTSITDSTFEADDAYQTLTEDYIYLPAGAVLSSDKEFGVYCFSDSFGINQIIMQGLGQKLDGYNPILASGTLEVKSTCYARLTVKGSLSDVKIEVPSGLKDSVICADRAAMELQPKIKVVNEFLTVGQNAVNYLFITDIHYGSGVDDLDGDGIRTYYTLEETKEQLAKLTTYVESVVTVANNSPYIDFVVIGGDIVNGYETPDSPAYKESQQREPGISIGKHLVYQLQQILAPLKNCKKPVFVLSGNHDDNTGHSIYRGNNPNQEQSITNWHVSDLDWDRGVLKEFVNVDVVRDDNYSYGGKSISKYYYYDLEKNGKTTRILCLDYNDDRFTFDSKGEVTARPNYGEYHDGQIEWLYNVGLKGDFDECIIFSHADMSSRSGSLEKLLSAYQTKTREKCGTISANFTDRTSGDIVLYHHGHEHKHYHEYNHQARFWKLSTAMAVETIDIISVNDNSIFKREIDNILINELLRNGTEKSTVQ